MARQQQKNLPTIEDYLTKLIDEAMAGEWVDEEDWEEYEPDLRERLRPLLTSMLVSCYNLGYRTALSELDERQTHKND